MTIWMDLAAAIPTHSVMTLVIGSEASSLLFAAQNSWRNHHLCIF
jgi:hypothetical protein